MKNKLNIAVVISILLFYSNLSAQIFSEKDVEICNAKFELAVSKSLQEKPINEVIVEIGKSFLGTKYVAHTVEKEGEEQLVINLTGLDCTTFLETSLALARCVKQNKLSFEDYQKELTLIRYRDGKIDQYPARLHYFSDWIFNNAQKGIIKDVTKNLGGVEKIFNVSYMSENPNLYLHLKQNPEFIQTIKNQEDKINSRKYFLIPKDKIRNIEDKIQSGDLVALTTNIKGLDIGHVGIAVKMDNGRIHFMHAPLVGSEVQISEQALGEYAKKIKKHTGIIVLRPQ